jgi:oligo-1,6-glucosidase
MRLPRQLMIALLLSTGLSNGVSQDSGAAQTPASSRKWWKEAVVYEVYPRSFKDSNGDGMGDLRGIVSKLDYIKSLDVDMFWMYSAYQSPDVDNGYDVSDYYSIDPRYGTMADFDELLKQIHKRGMKLQMELVVNHSSDRNKWFQESRKSKDNPYRRYYIWMPGKNGGPPNDWTALTGGSAWEYDPQTKEYYLHYFNKRQPDLNWDYPPLRQEIYKMMRFWLDKGVDGFRMDVIPLISKDSKFSNLGPRGVSGYEGGPHLHEYLQEMNREVLSHYNIATVGEGAFIDIEHAPLYTAPDRHELNMLFLFDTFGLGRGAEKYSKAPFSLEKLKSIVQRWDDAIEAGAWLAPFLESVDMPRVVSAWANEGEYRVPSAKMLATFLLTLRGTPYIFEGQEIGMTNTHFASLDGFNDVEARAFIEEQRAKHVPDPEILDRLNTFSRDTARTPMQWTDEKNGGFSTADRTWLPVNPNYRQINVSDSEKDPDSVLNYYRKMIRLHKETPALIYGRYKAITTDGKTFAYLRELGLERYLVVLNFDRSSAWFVLPDDVPYSQGELVISNYPVPQADDPKSFNLQPYEARVYRIK